MGTMALSRATHGGRAETRYYSYNMADEKEQVSTKIDRNTMQYTDSVSNNNLSSNHSYLAHPEYHMPNGYSNYDGYSYPQPQGNINVGDYQGYQQTQALYEERGCWRKLYDYQTGHWYYQNLWTNMTQWTAPVDWETWPVNNQQVESKNEIDNDETSGLSKLRKTSEEIERKNTEYTKRPARRQVDPEEAKKIHWRPEGANEYNIWYDKWIGDHWKGTKDDGRTILHSEGFPPEISGGTKLLILLFQSKLAGNFSFKL